MVGDHGVKLKYISRANGIIAMKKIRNCAGPISTKDIPRLLLSVLLSLLMILFIDYPPDS